VDIGSPASSAPPPPAAHFAPTIRKPLPSATALAWEPSEAAARLRAKNRGLPLVIYIRADWSAASIAVDRQVFSHPAVLAHARSFIALKLDVTPAGGDAELQATRHGVRALPTTIVCNAHGEEVVRLTGAIDAAALLEAIQNAGTD
jgi:thiol:disulfide interchange protein